MSVGDVNGFRRRQKVLAHKGQLPKQAQRTVAESIERNRAVALRMSKAAKKK